jgi:DNA-binding response OmpR family regulator
VFLTDRSPGEALPALTSLTLDVKTEPLTEDSILHLSDLGPPAMFVDAVHEPEKAHRVLSALVASGWGVPVAVVIDRSDLERYPWPAVADEFVTPDASPAELRVRMAMLTRRTGAANEATFTLGALALNVETYQVLVGGRPLDLTYKEFELLRFLVQRPGRVFTRSDLLLEVWGYNFYGGTRTVDVHIRRLRAKLGSEHESLIQTVRGVGYRAAEPHPYAD